MFLWQISVVALILGLYSIYLLIDAISKTKGNIKKALILFFITLSTYMLYNLIATFLVLEGTRTSEIEWLLFVLMHSIPGISWAFTTYTIYKLPDALEQANRRRSYGA